MNTTRRSACGRSRLIRPRIPPQRRARQDQGCLSSSRRGQRGCGRARRNAAAGGGYPQADGLQRDPVQPQSAGAGIPRPVRSDGICRSCTRRLTNGSSTRLIRRLDTPITSTSGGSGFVRHAPPRPQPSQHRPCWSIGNEIPDQSTARRASGCHAWPVWCHALDPHGRHQRLRQRQYRQSRQQHPPGFPGENSMWPVTITPTAGESVANCNTSRIRFSTRSAGKFIGTENSGMGGARGQYAFTLFGGSPRPCANYAASIIEGEQVWKFVALRDDVAGNFIWTGIDYLSARVAGAPAAVPLTRAGFPRTGSISTRVNGPANRWSTSSRIGTGRDSRAHHSRPLFHQLQHGRAVSQRQEPLRRKAMELPRLGSAGGWNTPPDADQSDDDRSAFVLGCSLCARHLAGRGLRSRGQRSMHGNAQDKRLASGRCVVRRPHDSRCRRSRCGSRDGEHRGTAGQVVPTGQYVAYLRRQRRRCVDRYGQRQPAGSAAISDGELRNAFNGLSLAVVQTTPRRGAIHIVIHANGLKDGIIDIDSKAASATALLP